MSEHDPQRPEPLAQEDVPDSVTDASVATAAMDSATDMDASPSVDQPRAHIADSHPAANDATGPTEGPPAAVGGRPSRAASPQERLQRQAAEIADREARFRERTAKHRKNIADMKRRQHHQEVAERRQERKMRDAQEDRARYRFADVLLYRMSLMPEHEWGRLVHDVLAALHDHDQAALERIVERNRTRAAANA